MKKAVAFILAVIMVGSLTACSGNKDKDKETVGTKEATNKIETDNTVEEQEASRTDLYWYNVELPYDAYEFLEAEYREYDGEVPQAAAWLEKVFDERQLAESTDFVLNFEGIDQIEDSTYATFSVFNKCPSDIIVHTNVIINDVTNCPVNIVALGYSYETVSVEINKESLAFSGSDSIVSARAGLVSVMYMNSLEGHDGLYYVNSNTELNTGEQFNGVEQIAGMQQIFSDVVCDAWVAPVKKGKDGTEVKGLCIVLHNKAKDLEIQLEPQLENYEGNLESCHANANSWGYKFIPLDTDEDVMLVKLYLGLFTGELEHLEREYLCDFAKAVRVE